MYAEHFTHIILYERLKEQLKEGAKNHTGNHLESLLKLSIYACVEKYLMRGHTPYDMLSHFYLAVDLCSDPL